MAATTQNARSLWGRATDYLLGRNTLIGIASIMLLLIAGFATWHGMRDFIIGVSTSPAGNSQELPGGLSFSNDFLVIVVVFALTFLMWLMLRETFAQGRRWTERLVTFPLYVFLAIWSIGFGYGFWWSLIAGEEATRTGLSGLQQDAGDAASAVAARLDAVKVGLDGVVTWSATQMAREETSGGSCGTTSGAGRGPLYSARVGVRDQITSLRDGVQNSWIAPVQADIASLQQSVAQLQGSTVAERQQSFNAMATNIRSRARDIAARSNELGKSTATEMRAIAAAVSVAPGQSGFSCYDPTLAQRLTQAAVQADQPATLNLREAAFNEGPAGVANAIKRLWENIGSYLSSLIGWIAGARAGWRHQDGRADHRPRYDRAARHHRHRPRPAGAGHPQSAAAGEQTAVVCGRPPDPRGDQHRHPARAGRQTSNGCAATSSITGARRTSSFPTSTVAIRRTRTNAPRRWP